MSDSEDIVAEAFASILDLLHRGGGPEDDFRPYLFTCIRHGSTTGAGRRGPSRWIRSRWRGRPRQPRRVHRRRRDDDGVADGLRRGPLTVAEDPLAHGGRGPIDRRPGRGALPLTGCRGVALLPSPQRALDRLPRRLSGQHLTAAVRRHRPQLQRLRPPQPLRRRAAPVEAHLAECSSCRSSVSELEIWTAPWRG